MAESAGASAGGIFISYRREETPYSAGWLYDRLVEHFGARQVFKDIDSIELGDDFVEVISTAVGSCEVLLALIGDRWLASTDEDGRRRLDDPADFVRVEIEAALTRNVRVIPILVGGARMPPVAELPPSLAKLARRQALELSPARFDSDTSRLLRVLDRTLAEVRTAHQEHAALTVSEDERTGRSTRHLDRQRVATRRRIVSTSPPSEAPIVREPDKTPLPDNTAQVARRHRQRVGRVVLLVAVPAWLVASAAASDPADGVWAPIFVLVAFPLGDFVYRTWRLRRPPTRGSS